LLPSLLPLSLEQLLVVVDHCPAQHRLAQLLLDLPQLK
jgi:hypothetical protein